MFSAVMIEAVVTPSPRKPFKNLKGVEWLLGRLINWMNSLFGTDNMTWQ